jgi:hypothetical protein
MKFLLRYDWMTQCHSTVTALIITHSFLHTNANMAAQRVTWTGVFAVRKTQTTGSPRLHPAIVKKLTPRADSFQFHSLTPCVFLGAEKTNRYHIGELKRRYSSASAHSPLLVADLNLIDYKSCPPQFPPSSTVKNLNNNATQHHDSSFPISFDPTTVAVYPNVCSEIEEESLIQDLSRLFQR